MNPPKASFKHGKAFSLLDWQRGYGDVQIEVAHHYVPPSMLLSQYAGPSDDRPPSDRSSAWTCRTRKRKVAVYIF